MEEKLGESSVCNKRSLQDHRTQVPLHSREEGAQVVPEADPLSPRHHLSSPSCKGVRFTWGQKEEKSKEKAQRPHDLQGLERSAQRPRDIVANTHIYTCFQTKYHLDQ